MTTKHTSGPWHIKTAVSGNHFVYSEKSCQSDDRIAGIRGDYPNSEIATANARLIAAAPEMLRVLKYALANITEVAIPQSDELGRVTSLPDCADKLRAALAKAEGQS